MDRNQQQHDNGQSRARQFESMAEVALRGTALLWDLQMEAARNLWRTQARTAAMLGIPDCSELFHVGDDRARRLFSASSEQMLNSARQTRETVFEMQRQIGRLAEQQTIGITEEVRDQIEQIGQHTEQGLQEIRQMTASEVDHIEAMAQRNGEAHSRGATPAGEAQAATETGTASNAGRPQRETRRHEERPRARR